MPYTVQISRAADRAFEKIADRKFQQRIADRIKVLADNPRPSGVEKLSGFKDLYRIRVGSFRIVYQIQDQNLLVLVIRIGDRKEVYRQGF